GGLALGYRRCACNPHLHQELGRSRTRTSSRLRGDCGRLTTGAMTPALEARLEKPSLTNRKRKTWKFIYGAKHRFDFIALLKPCFWYKSHGIGCVHHLHEVRIWVFVP